MRLDKQAVVNRVIEIAQDKSIDESIKLVLVIGELNSSKYTIDESEEEKAEQTAYAWESLYRKANAEWSHCLSTIQQLREERDEYKQFCEESHQKSVDLYNETVELTLSLIRTQGEAARLREALEWYADEANHKSVHPVSDYRQYISNVQVDKGYKARQALSSHTEDTGTAGEFIGVTFTGKLATPSEDTGIQKVHGIEWIRFVPQVAKEQLEETEYLIFYDGRIVQATHDAMGAFFYRDTKAGMVIYPYRSISHYAEFNVPGITEDKPILQPTPDPVRDNCVTFNAPGQFTCQCEPGTCRDASITIPGITDGGETE